MAKGMIVVDKIPRNCRNIRGDTENGCPHGGMVCQISLNDVMQHVQDGTRPDWCPIQHMPEKRNEHDACYDSDFYRAEGWNACIDEILKGDIPMP